MSKQGPVSEVLEADLQKRLREKSVLIWLDNEDHYTPFVDSLRETAPYEVHGYRGSFLDLLFELENTAASADPSPVLLHLPGFTEESVKATPVFELYKAGTRYRKALDTLVTEAAAGRVPPESLAAYLDDTSSLQAADAWLADQLAGAGGLSAQVKGQRVEAIVDDLLGGGPLAKGVEQSAAERDALVENLRTRLGTTEAWREEHLPGGAVHGEDVAFLFASWALAVEYVNDLRREPKDAQLRELTKMPAASVSACSALAAHLRERQPRYYERWAGEVQELFPEEVATARAEDLGKVDTFRFEEEAILRAALDALGDGAWERALEWATPRAREGYFWIRRSPHRRAAWSLALDAANLGQAMAKAGDALDVTTLEDAIDAYAERGAAVDRAHRLLEQRRLELLFPQHPEFTRIRGLLDDMRRRWRAWADKWALEFSALCRERGFLPAPERQQRTLFDDVVRPMTQEGGTTALFMVDALRFEMAQELVQEMEGARQTTVQLKARLAELPTVTEVGMNVLAPVCRQGRLAPELQGGKVKGFAAGDFRVFNPETRRKAMQARVGGKTCPLLDLADVLSRDAASLRRAVSQAELVVVHSLEIDKAGENGAGPQAFPQALRQLRAAWHLLREAGVTQFVITADHGFLLLGGPQDKAAQPHGRKIDPSRRHVFSTTPADHKGEARVALRDLGYDGAEGYVLFPESTAVFDTGGKAQTFVHGGNSLQERVIPVLTVRHRAKPGGDSASYAVRLKDGAPLAGMHCLGVTVEVADQTALNFGGTRELELGLRVPGRGDVLVQVEDARGKARVKDGALFAEVGESFEVFFHLTGPGADRVAVEVYHPVALAKVAPAVSTSFFGVSLAVGEAVAQTTGAADGEWLQHLPEALREVFHHLQVHGTITEAEVTKMLGGNRQARRFSSKWEEHAAKAPFEIRVEMAGAMKRWVREGSQG